MAGLGVQVLFGFLLSLPFTVRFVRVELASALRFMWPVCSWPLCLPCSCVVRSPTTGLVFRRHEKELLLQAANVMALTGLATVALAISTAVLLVVSFVERGAPVVIIAVATFSGFAVLWFALPLTRRHPPGAATATSPPQRRRGGSSRSEKTGHAG